jgi:hypothetical protein
MNKDEAPVQGKSYAADGQTELHTLPGVGLVVSAVAFNKLATTPPAAQGWPEGMGEFLADLTRSRTKYPKNGRMFDGLMGEIDELRRAYAGDGDMRAEAFDVAVCAYRIATEGDAGGNVLLATPPAQQEPSLRIDFAQATKLVEMFGGAPSLVTLYVGDGHSGRGMYAYFTEYPEDGDWFLAATDGEAIPPAAAKRQWVGLTDDDLVACSDSQKATVLYFMKKLKEKNNG